MNCFVNTGWKEVDRESFDEFLKTCPDYERDNWANGAFYSYRQIIPFKRRKFAFEYLDGKIVVDPQLLE